MAQLEQEMLLTVDSFKKPKVLEGKEAIGILLVRLIQLEPGTIASRPKMGVGLLSNYRYCDEQKALQLQDHIKDQIRTYFPEYQGVRVATKLNANGQLIIDKLSDGIVRQTSDKSVAYINGVSEDIFKVGFCLPAGPYVTDEDVRYIVDCIKEAII
jgi:hypothetical protein